MHDWNESYQRWLEASYVYYILDDQIMMDVEYDHLSKELLGNWDCVTHEHKGLISEDDLRAGTGFAISRDKYPTDIVTKYK
jgi:NAD-dependent DNA ligase